jgi:hypothetical protein
MVGHTHGDPDAIRDFARGLQQYASDSHDRLAHLHKWLEDMGTASWTDTNHAKYQELFDGVETRMRKGLEEFDDQVAYLIALAQRYQDVLDQ